MTFNLNGKFKVLHFVWRDYDGQTFRESNFVSSALPYMWYRFWWMATIYNIVRYSTLAALSPDERVVLEFYLCKQYLLSNA